MSDVDVYFSFRSPYSYLATPDMLKLKQDYTAAVNLRPVFPIAVRNPEFFDPSNLKRARYIGLDWVRRAEFLGMAKHWPNPDPITQNMETYEIAEEQPLIHELTKLGVEAQRQGRGIEFAKHVSHLIFGGIKDWNQGDRFTKAVSDAGLNLAELRVNIEKGNHLEEISANQDALEAAGHWGVPTYVFNNEPFFGQDRIDLLRWRLDQNNLNKA
ncbi:MAG: 2-hydroxychromene-2-carboxylate isomerase [Pseudohongiellaceae bacterium]|jgi:2-hydroxychromene-2-carboxylate isomerase